ncbi:MAG: N-acetylmuramoyl-L-alanine amidase [Rhodospirillales bacterium]|nr:N-acetylmuramoyl-L-alanine amidase [Rhodospirillales bacterium]MCB9996706.1 N-acetylmuramoyl-L-alanine amidase [Rhodospirillales bacterium]
MNIIKRQSDHFEDRANGARPDLLIIHYTETRTLEDAEDYFLGRKPHPGGGRVSTHYMIDRDGTVIQYVDDDKRAWHAGISHWNGMDDINSHAIGIELVNPGRKYGYEPFTAQQMQRLVTLCKDLMARYGISPHGVIGHSDVAPERKSDPGELFDWKMLAGTGCAVWPQPDEQDRRVAQDYVRDESSLREAFTKVGYNPKADLQSVITAFQRHFYPEAFKDPEQVGKINGAAAARLHWLVRNRPHL